MSFWGTKISPEPVKESENFWSLVGKKGVIVSEELKVNSVFPEKGKQALIQFDVNLDELGLPNHNPVENSLWIFVDDLEEIIN